MIEAISFFFVSKEFAKTLAQSNIETDLQANEHSSYPYEYLQSAEILVHQTWQEYYLLKNSPANDVISSIFCCAIKHPVYTKPRLFLRLLRVTRSEMLGCSHRSCSLSSLITYCVYTKRILLEKAISQLSTKIHLIFGDHFCNYKQICLRVNYDVWEWYWEL